MKHTARYTGLKRGQIVVFIVLIFQVFFIFGAMVINIGMVVHDKINLQNSVDLAALYGAQRQAEVLDALAHINYQIRQSYKLMAWRYLILGNFGANFRESGNPQYNMFNRGSPQDTAHCNFLLDTCKRPGSPPRPKGLCNIGEVNNGECAYAVCMGHKYWGWAPHPSGDHLCQGISLEGSNIQRPSNISVGGLAEFLGGRRLEEAIRLNNEAIVLACNKVREVNWFTASTFLSFFRYDQWKRKILANELFNKTIGKGLDIEGQLIATGIENTIKNNLTFINYRNYSNPNTIKTIQATSDGDFKKYFKWQQIAPVLFYVFTKDDPDKKHICDSNILPIFHPPDDILSNNGMDKDNLLYRSSRLSDSVSAENDEYHEAHLSSGFYKNNKKTIYTEVYVDIPYTRQIFLPFSGNNMRLKAWAFAKPFGAVFGPPPGADSHLPSVPLGGPSPQLLPGTDVSAGAYNHLLYLAPNYSSFPGDSLGLFRHAVQYYWTDQLKENLSGKKGVNYNSSTGIPEKDPMVLNWSGSRDSKADLQTDSLRTEMRRLEEIVIAPDAFDLMYYTILPNYMTTLYRRMMRHDELVARVTDLIVTNLIPGDLGYFDIEDSDFPEDFRQVNQHPPKCNLNEFRLDFINKQIKCASSVPETYKPYLHKVTNLDHLLTSWYPITRGGYTKPGLYNVAENDYFGTCDKGDEVKIEDDLVANGTITPQTLIPHHCLKGGRSGFSVKLIHKDMAIQYR